METIDKVDTEFAAATRAIHGYNTVQEVIDLTEPLRVINLMLDEEQMIQPSLWWSSSRISFLKVRKLEAGLGCLIMTEILTVRLPNRLG